MDDLWKCLKLIHDHKVENKPEDSKLIDESEVLIFRVVSDNIHDNCEDLK